jgi:hypothetical protein
MVCDGYSDVLILDLLIYYLYCVMDILDLLILLHGVLERGCCPFFSSFVGISLVQVPKRLATFIYHYAKLFKWFYLPRVFPCVPIWSIDNFV